MLTGINPLLVGTNGLNVDQVFSTTLYNQPSASNLNLPIAPHLVWHKSRADDQFHFLVDSIRGDNYLSTNNTNSTVPFTAPFSGISPNGIKKITKATQNNISSVVWSFRCARRFFDIVTYTGNGVQGRSIPHSLNQIPGLVIIKCLDVSGDWYVQHISRPSGSFSILNQTVAEQTAINVFPSKADASNFYLGNVGDVNQSGRAFVAYLFAHDPLPSGIIKCGMTPGTARVELGWEPQYLLMKRYDGSGSWLIHDSKRGWIRSPQTGNSRVLYAEGGSSEIQLSAGSYDNTGFNPNYVGQYVYMAIRKGRA